MNPIKVMVNGLPGNVSRIVAAQILKDERFELVPYSLTGPEIQEPEYSLESVTMKLIQPDKRKSRIEEVIKSHEGFLSVDYTHPSAVNSNAEFYCGCGLPFVMGTTGGDRKKLEETVISSSIAAVIAPNMAKQIVGFQAMMAYAADTFPGLFKGYSLEIRESHQKGKADTSGTAKAMVGYFNGLGIPFSEDQILKCGTLRFKKPNGAFLNSIWPVTAGTPTPWFRKIRRSGLNSPITSTAVWFIPSARWMLFYFCLQK